MQDKHETHKGLPDLRKSELMHRLDAVIAEMGQGPAADAERELLLDLQAHQIELEMQGRELREAQQGLEVSRDHYARLFDLAPVGYVILGKGGLIRDVNLTGARMLKRHRQELVGRPFAALLQPRDMRRLLRHVDRMLGSDPAARCDHSLVVHARRGNGHDEDLRTLQLLSASWSGDTGTECLSAIIDITAQEQAQRGQQLSDQLRQAVLDALPAQIAVIDADGKIVAVNRVWRCFAEENGAAAEVRDALGLDYLAACRGAGGSDAVEAGLIADGIASVLSGQSDHFLREYPCHAPGRERWYAVTAAPLQGATEGAVIAHLDISEQKRAERDSRHAREAMAQAARVNAVGILAASLIHELAQPLSAASFYSGAAISLLERPDTAAADVTRMLSGVDTQIRRAAKTVQRLRDFLRWREMDLQPVQIDQVLSDAVGLLHWFAADHNVRVRLARSAPDLIVEADTVQLEQVLVNLICNSILAIDRAGAQRREVSLAIDKQGDQVEVTVSDTGPGLPPESPEHLFNIFSSRSDASLGMGLAISRDIVESHGGKLWAEREPNQGAVFHFRLPLAAQGTSA
jgi:two-component system sensor kinase FixL